MISACLAALPDLTTVPSPFWLLTVSAGEHSARATIAWADESLAALAATPGTAR